MSEPPPQVSTAVPAGARAARPPGGAARWRRVKRYGLALLPVAAAALALELLRRQLETQDLGEMVGVLAQTPASSLLLGSLMTALGYLTLTGYDWLALRYIESPVSFRKSAPISLVAYGIGNALGFPLFTSTPIRFRLYATVGLDTFQVVKLISFIALSFWLGLFSLAGLVLLLDAPALSQVSGIAEAVLRVVGTLLLALVASYLLLVFNFDRPLRVRGWEFSLPSGPLASGQLALSLLDAVLTASVLWVLLPDRHGLSVVAFLGAYLLAQTLALLSHVPGGLGVFDASIVTFLSPVIPPAETAVGLVLFRALYYLLPLLLSAIGLVLVERRALMRAAGDLEDKASPLLGMVVPRVMAITTFLAGAVLLVSGSWPALTNRMATLDRFVPLSFLETSHLLSSVLGLVLLILANGIRRRLDGAWHVTVVVIAAGIVLALVRGLDFEEASLLTVVLVMLLVSKRHFYRKATLLSRPFSPRWLLALGVVVASGLWLGLIAHGNADYSQERLWQFSLNGEVPRFLRTQVAVLATLVVFGFLRLFRGAEPVERSTSPEDLERIEALVVSSPRTMATLAYIGDKHFLLDEQKRGFVMYGISGDSWIAMGDPIGPEDVVEELVWRFREACDLYDERPVFYQAGPSHLPIYLEAGLSVLKLGEAARTPLQDFGLEGSARRDLRQGMRKAQREQLRFEVVERERVPALLPELRKVSNDWLESKNTAEKSFSIGAFSDAYLGRFPMTLVLREGRILAFANLLLGAERAEISVDLMRYRREAPPGIMDYLFVQIMLWGRSQGYRSFHLGMTPLAGLEDHPLAPVWNRLGSWMFRHGEHFYNFQGLRSYKEKFEPIWEPRYLVAPQGLATSRALLDVSVLIAGGYRGLLLR